MAGPGKIAGIASLFVDGVAVTAEGSLKYKPTNTMREPKVAMDGSLAGWKEKGDPPYMACTLMLMPGVSLAQMFANTNIQIVALLANGTTVTGHSMTQMEAVEGDNEEATFEMKWIGPSVTESF